MESLRQQAATAGALKAAALGYSLALILSLVPRPAALFGLLGA